MPYIEHIYYEETGGGPPVILIHCPGVSHVYWRPIMDRLGSACRCIAIDLRGHGNSGRAEEPWTFRDISRDLALLTRQLGLERPVLVGYSAGGAIALQAALDEPALYRGIVSVSGFSECSTLPFKLKVQIGLLGVHLGLVSLVGPNIVGTNSVGKAHTRAMIPDAKRVSPKSLRSYYLATLGTNLTSRLSEVGVPVLLVHGAKDDWMHKYYRILRAGLPDSRTLFFPRTDHRVPTRHPDQFSDAVAAFVASI